MHITKFTDYSMRTLMYVALLKEGELANISDISKTFDISRNHLMKVVNNLATLDLVVSIRGRSGGIKLGRPANTINVGAVIKDLEPIDRVVDCETGPCIFQGACALDSAIQAATNAFLVELNRYTLADLVKRKSKLNQLIQFHA